MPSASVSNYKLAIPVAHRDAISREDLLGRIFGSSARVIAIQAPAGHGKTSLMVQSELRCRRGGSATAWLSLDEADNDPRLFNGHLQQVVAAVRASHVAPSDAPIERASEIASRAEWIIDQLTQLPGPSAIFLDDLHAITAQPSLLLLRDVLARSPRNIRWFVASRAIREVGLSRLVVSSEAIILRADDVRFTIDESRRFFQRPNAPIVSHEEIDAIHAVTEGWPAGLQLYRLALGSPAVRASLDRRRPTHVTELTDYLADNVLSRLGSQVQDFLLKTSFCRRMSVELCDFLLDSDDACSNLLALEREGLFIRRLEMDGPWYTYHAVFAVFLQERLRSSAPSQVEEIHRRAGAWFQERGLYEEALHHLCAINDFARAAAALEKWADQLIPEGHMVTVDRWSERLPLSVLTEHPGLLVKVVWALAFLSRHHKLTSLLSTLRRLPRDNFGIGDPAVAACMVAILEDDLQRAVEIVEPIDTSEHADNSFRLFELSAVSNARGYASMARGDFDEALEYLTDGHRLSQRADASFTGAYAVGKTAVSLISQGRLTEAVTKVMAALADRRIYLDESLSQACLICALIMALYESNDLDGAFALFTRSRTLIANAVHDYLVVAYRAAARISSIRGQTEDALAILNEAENIAHAGQWPRAIALIRWERVYQALMRGSVEAANVIAGRIRRRPAMNSHWIRFSEEVDGELFCRIRIALASKRNTVALRMVAPALTSADANGRVFRQIKLGILAAIAHRNIGDSKTAHRCLRDALKLGAGGRYFRSFLDEGEAAARLLYEHANIAPRTVAMDSDTLVDRFLEELIAASEGDGPPKSVRSSPLLTTDGARAAASFTEREQSIVQLLRQYMTNDQIAAALFISRETVKYHLKHIYDKLAVSSRLEAIKMLSAADSS